MIPGLKDVDGFNHGTSVCTSTPGRENVSAANRTGQCFRIGVLGHLVINMKDDLDILLGMRQLMHGWVIGMWIGGKDSGKNSGFKWFV